LLAEHYPIFIEAERVIADPTVRNRGTIGGSFCQADPSEDLSAVGSALRANLIIRSAAGSRVVPAREFHDGPYQTLVGPAEILTEIRIPIRTGIGSSYEKVERRAGDWAIAASGTFVQLEGDTVSDCGIGITAVGSEHFTCAAAEDFLRGKAASAENFATAGQMCADASAPQSDQRGPADYKRHLAGELTRRSLVRSAASAKGATA
jgi:aerobic carbon-monoxide dehydrogenase medium subunit